MTTGARDAAVESDFSGGINQHDMPRRFRTQTCCKLSVGIGDDGHVASAELARGGAGPILAGVLRHDMDNQRVTGRAGAGNEVCELRQARLRARAPGVNRHNRQRPTMFTVGIKRFDTAAGRRASFSGGRRVAFEPCEADDERDNPGARH